LKQLILCVAMLSLILSGIAFADEQNQEQSTIVGPVMQNRYIQPEDLQDKPALSETAKKLMDQGVIQAVEDAKVNTQASGVKK